MNRMPRLVQEDGRHDGDFVLRYTTCLAARPLSAKVGVIDLDLAPQQVGLLTISHRPQNLVVPQPSRVVLHAQVATKLQRGDPGFGLAAQIEGQEPGGEWQFCDLHDRAGRERGLMAAVATLIAIEPPTVDEPMLMAISARTAEPTRAARLLKGSLTLLLGAVQPLEIRQGVSLLELDRAAGHGWTGICIPLYDPKVAAAERAG